MPKRLRTPTDRQRAVLVLGAGRSGTSITARALQAIGVDLGNDFKPPSRKNPTGNFDDAALLKLSKRLRRTLGLRPDSLRLLDDDVWTSPAVMPFYGEFAATINDRFGHASIWGFKYARTMRLLPFWVHLFHKMNIEPSFVMPVRNPLSVARSRAKLDARRGVQANSDLEWLVNVVPYFDCVRGAHLVVIDYDNLMENPSTQLLRMADRLGLPVSDRTKQEIHTFANSFIQRSLQHSRFSIEELQNANNINVLVRDAYCLLDRLSRDEIRSDDPGLWSSWEKLTTDLNALGPILSQTDQLNHELRLARWNPFSFVAAGRDLVQRFLRG
jgi:hypothetical protein